MPRPQHHVFICNQQRPPGHPRGCCQQNGSTAVLQAFWKEQQARNAFDNVAVTYSGCLGPCDQGPNVLVYPEGVLYRGVKVEDVGEIFEKHLLNGETVARLVTPEAVW